MVDFAQLMASTPPVQNPVAGGRPFGGLLPDLTMQPLIPLGANAIPLFSRPVIVAFMSQSKASGSKMHQAIQATGGAFLQNAWNTQGFQYASIEPGTSIQAPRFGGGGGDFGIV